MKIDNTFIGVDSRICLTLHKRNPNMFARSVNITNINIYAPSVAAQDYANMVYESASVKNAMEVRIVSMISSNQDVKNAKVGPYVNMVKDAHDVLTVRVVLFASINNSKVGVPNVEEMPCAFTKNEKISVQNAN